MEEEFDFGSAEEQKKFVNRFEEMIRNEDQYFFDANTFESIIDFYSDKNDSIKALQVIEFATSQHPYEAGFYAKKAEILSLMRQCCLALEAIVNAESLEPSDSHLLLIISSIYASQEMFDSSEELLNQALENAENQAEIFHHLATISQMQANFAQAKVFLKKSL